MCSLLLTFDVSSLVGVVSCFCLVQYIFELWLNSVHGFNIFELLLKSKMSNARYKENLFRKCPEKSD